MAFDLSGHVLRAPRIAPSNAPTTAEPSNGVVRDIRPVPGAYDLAAEAPSFVDVYADQYRAAILEAPGTSPVEYLLWAANSSNLALVDDASWAIDLGTGYIPLGEVEVGSFSDGSDRIIVKDNGGRDIGTILEVTVTRGDTGDEVVLTVASANQDGGAGVVWLTQAQKDALDGGVSQDRGDKVTGVRYTLAPAKFWWTRNDRYQTRFGWSDQAGRWQPYKGGAPKNLGVLAFDEVYTLSPRPRGLQVGDYLPGDADEADAYSMIRLGTQPGASTSTGLGSIKVVPDKDAKADYDFADSTIQGVLGLTNGKLVFNPSFVEQNAGKVVWYIQRDFEAGASGLVGKMTDTDLYITPIPTPTDHPFIRLGSRRYLTPIIVDLDADLDETLPAPGQVVVSASTGRLRFSSDDLAKADPTDESFDKHYLGESVYYDGVALNAVAQPTKKPVTVSDVGGTLYIPNAVTLPTEFVNTDLYRGLGVSGVLDIPDGTGAVPGQEGVEAPVRPGGDTLLATSTGRVRAVEDGVGDTILFSKAGAITTLSVVDTPEDLPSPFKIPKGTAFIAKKHDGTGSQVRLSTQDASAFEGEDIYFLQATLLPAFYTRSPRLYSRTRLVFRFKGGETLYFAIDGTAFAWTATAGRFTADEVAESIQDLLGVAGLAYALNGHVVLASISETGTVEIGWGVDQVKDLSGAAALGFLPGWRVKGGVDNWLPDSGVGFGLYRSPVNLDRSRETADFYATDRVDDVVLTTSITAMPFVPLDHAPLADVAGFDEGVFFQIRTSVGDDEQVTISNRPLTHYGDVLHRFSDKRLLWLEEGVTSEKVERATTTLGLGNPSVVPESLLGAPGVGGGLYVAPEGGAFVLQKQGTDYLLPQDGQSGTALLVERFGSKVLSGSRGAFTVGQTEFTDPSANFLAASDEVAVDDQGQPVFDEGEPVYLPVVREGYRLKVTGGSAAGSYTILDVGLDGTSLTVTPAFPATASKATTWEIYEGYTEDVYDPSVVADQVYEEFDHLPEEPFKVRVLSRLGTVSNGTGLLTANLQGALASGRDIKLRFGFGSASAANTATLVALQQYKLGSLANYLVLPDTAHVASGKFVLRIGTEVYDPTPVQAFSDPVGSSAVEYLTESDGAYEAGTLKFGSQILSDLEGADTWCVEIFNSPSDLTALQAEYDPRTGEVNLSEADRTSFEGEPVYLVERMVARRDVFISPLTGAVGFSQPVQTGQVVEAEYYQADLEGRQTGDLITEFLSVFVKGEEASRQTPFEYHFNLTGRKIDTRIEPVVYIGPTLQNFGTTDYLLDYPEHLGGRGRLTFIKNVPEHVTVKVTYAVYDANGGERSYEVSTKPVYRPPFFIQAGKDNFGLRGDRTADFVPGQLLRFGEHCFYVRAVTRYEASDLTKVTIFPSTTVEVGSRSPGNDVLRLMTRGAVTTVVDPDGSAPVLTEAPAGFMQTLPTDTFSFEPVNRGQTAITFLGDLTQFAKPGHLLEVGGRPFTIAQVEQSTDGTRTIITLTAPFQTGFSMDSPPTVKLSYRPVYPPEARDFVGVGAVLDTEPVELVLYAEGKPGRTLVPTVEYNLDPMTGGVRLMPPVQAALAPGEKLVLSFTRVRSLSPFVKDGAVVTPRYFASYRYNTLPSTDNGFLGGELTASYSFHSPDTFYCRALPLSKFMGEAVKAAQDEIRSKQPAGGALKTPATGMNNWDRGRLGIRGELRHLHDQDRAARTFLDLYNSIINAFEQVGETISGSFIGDRDGKFRFYIGKGSDWPKPGYEDDITGRLVSRNLWAEVVQAENPERDVFVGVDDWIVHPSSLGLSNGQVTGSFPNADALDRLIASQVPLVRNDVDDVLLVKTGRASVTVTASAPFFSLRAPGVFQRMGDNHPFSRLFPSRTRGFFITHPGVGDDGRYTWGVTEGGRRLSTYRKEIGQVANPVLGAISNITDGAMFKRRARARIWGYFPSGLPAGAFVLEDGSESPAIDRPCLIATPADLAEFPVHPDTGYPDREQLLSQGGDVPDAEAGDPNLAVPGFQAGDRISWGRPDGSLYDAFVLEQVSVFGKTTLTGLYVQEVLYGCVLTFQTSAGEDVLDSSKVLVATGAESGIPAHEFPLAQGDTVFATPAVDEVPVDPSEAVALTDDLMRAAAAMDHYRLGFDLSVQSDGRVLDLSLPSFQDPYFIGVKEVMGQKSPEPLTPIEGVFSFTYTGQNPLEVPALKGEARDDSGDVKIPYQRSVNTELDRFRQASVVLAEVMTAKNSGKYVYPDEIVGNDGLIVDSAGGVFGLADQEPGTLMSMQDALEATHNPQDLGVGDLRRYDLLLVEVNDAGSNLGLQGWASVGEVSSPEVAPGQYGSFIEVPRFVTPTQGPLGGVFSATGSPIRYTFDNALSYTNDSYPADPQADPPAGVRLIELDTDGDGVRDTTILDFSDIGQIALNNGAFQGKGNLNDLWADHSGDPAYYNKITLTLFAREDAHILETPGGNPLPAPGEVLYTITLEEGMVTATDWAGHTTTSVAATGLLFGVTHDDPGAAATDSKQIVLPTAGLLDFSGALHSGWFLPFVVTNEGLPGERCETLYGWEFSLSVDTYNYKSGPGTKGRSITAYISEDRLTFNEVLDLRLMKARGSTHPLNASTSLEGRLLVHEVTCGDGVAYTVNKDANGGQPLTFIPRSTGLGSWVAAVAGVSHERGSVKALGFEGWDGSDTRIVTASDVRFTALPSSEYGPEGIICTGTGVTESASNASVPDAWQYDNRIVQVTVADGAVGNVESGDILIIDGSSGADKATTKAGTYLVRHAVEPDAGMAYKALSLSTVSGSGTGWAPVRFPTVVGFDSDTNLLTISDLAEAAEGPLVDGKRTGFDTTFASNPRIFVVRSVAGLGSADPTTFAQALVSARYTAIDASGDEPVFTLTDYQDANGDPLTAAKFGELASEGMYVSGMAYLPVRIRGDGKNLPINNVCGHHSVADNSTYGFRWVTLTPPGTLSDAEPLVFGTGMGTDGEIKDSATAGHLHVILGTVEASTSFLDSTDRIVYDGVPATLSVLGLSTSQWNKLNYQSGGGKRVECLLPGTTMALDNEGDPGFYAQGGVFLEPSFPKMGLSLFTAYAHLVDSGHSLQAADVGMRNAADYLGAGEVASSSPEGVHFTVRRIRRFHKAQEEVFAELRPLRYAYEIRRGTVTDYQTTAKQFGELMAAEGTQLGFFDDPDVGIHAGDLVRLLDTDGTVLDEAEIVAVLSSTKLKLAVPGFTKASPVGKKFQVFLRQAPVPHEQSCEQLLDLLTFKEVHRTTADYDLEVGGYVPATDRNKLYDDSLAEGETFPNLGVKVGDIVVIDPAGVLPTGERGAGPVGDQGVAARTDAEAFIAGSPSPLDDNRGFYRVTAVEDDHLVVTGACSFAGDLDSDVLFPESVTDVAAAGYAIYPTVSASVLTGGREGQMDLRPTEKKVGDSFATNAYSLRPFSYRIIRPSTFFSEETVDLVLMMRERMLSWIEKIQTSASGDKAGSYFVFQRDEHAQDVGSPTDSQDGLGVLSNLVIEGIVGRTDISPFVNTSDCLSILDRRFWILDRSLDSMVPVNNVQSRKAVPGDPAYPTKNGPYTAYTATGVGSSVRPVLPERIEMVLDTKDRFRPIRYVWLAYRTHRVLGTLAAIQRYEAELPGRLDEQKRHLLLLESTENSDL